MGQIVTKNDSIVKINKHMDELISQGRFKVPPNYSVENALNSAWLKIVETKMTGKDNTISVLDPKNGCTGASIQNALLNMVIQGLSPVKDQCYFVPYGRVLTMLPSYFGKIAALKQVENVKKIYANIIYEKDEIDIDYDEERQFNVITHHSPFGNQDSPIIGAYCEIAFEDGTKHLEVMTIKQLENAWSMSKAPNSMAHKLFPDQMAKRTIISRAIKMFIKTTNDEDAVVNSILETEENEYKPSEVGTQFIEMEKDKDGVAQIIEKEEESSDSSKDIKDSKDSKDVDEDFDGEIGFE